MRAAATNLPIFGGGPGPRQEGQAAESSMKLSILYFKFRITGDMSASNMTSLTVYRNRQFLTSSLEDLNRDFGHTDSAGQIDCI